MSGVSRRPLWAIEIVRDLTAAARAADFFSSTDQSAQNQKDKSNSSEPVIGRARAQRIISNGKRSD
jgi:hypothetical protein